MKGAALAALLPLLAAGCARARAPEAVYDIPDFSVTAVKPGAVVPFGRKDLLGKVWIAEFIFTRCGGPCPAMTEHLAALSKRLPSSVGLLCVTVDPKADTPEVLRGYARVHGLDAARWVLLRGTVEQTYQLVFAGFRLPMSTQPDAPAEARVTHSTRLVLIDKNAAVRGYYDGLDDDSDNRLARDARLLSEVGS